MRKLITEAITAGCAFILAAALGHCNQGCAVFQSQEAVATAYKAELADCAAKAKTLSESKQCRAGVNAKYKVCEDPGAWPQYRPCQ